MKCPLGSGGRVGLFAGRWHEVLLGSRDGAGDEDTRSVKGGVKPDQRGGVGVDQDLMVKEFDWIDRGAGAEACVAVRRRV